MCQISQTILTPAGKVEPPSRRVWLRARRHACDEGAQAAVEMALCLPVLLLVLTGVLTFGVALHNYLMLTDATNIGARQLAISRGQTTDPCSTTATTVYAAAPNLQQGSLSFRLVLNGTTYSGASCSSANTTTGAAGNLVQGSTAQVTVTYPCSLAVYATNFAPNCTLTAQTTELVQ